ncbi:MAG: STAS-like domain-containing protein [Stellaceae bacterium]
MDARTISVGKDFNPAPAGRSFDDGPFSGEAFRKRVLIPALENANVVVVQLDDTEGYGSSFLEEAFGGLVRDGKFTAQQLHNKLRLQSDEDPSLVQEIWSYIDRAKPL